ncbi:nucleolin [Nematocida parisii]|uniref:RRM domain-containing protein n=1 Tax=Nematocida parisii (strain ERTm3) TaxID=935791 RepID=I3EG04_NEMP3|nr:uncharacterized protein NEPG_01355 [Nematocida parisii ERTm1]EIJ88151.1 hypothetical protein NEQG_01595 [Nematocida parisii ERTm3]KAI5130202.1 nucleolin [Nematocida parisii]EIJ93783.1 hypothetical protein NEPG_01355 [Nematocida parisii ERTm1]KAI5130226.1 nucleolin [Nematocida parisii]KAI5143818.1 nucleolin [Nematocida parisii]|eukprot:XP_013059183.1 hypothetical protein NEPG_01355 [Nematocida parisii ERTm1]
MAVRKTQNKKEETNIKKEETLVEKVEKPVDSEEQTASETISNDSVEEASESPTETGSEEEEGSSSASESASEESAKEEKKAEPEESKDERTIFIKGLNFSATEEDLRELFGKFGDIVEVRIPRSRDGPGGKGFGYVEFETKEACEKSRELNGTDFNGRSIVVDLARSGQRVGAGADGQKVYNKTDDSTVFLGNIPFDVDHEDFLSHLKTYAEVSQVRIPEDRETGRPKGFAFASCESVEEAQKLINSNIVYMDRNIRAQISERKNSPAPRGGNSFGRRDNNNSYGRRDNSDRSSGFGNKRTWSSENTSNKRHVKFE